MAPSFTPLVQPADERPLSAPLAGPAGFQTVRRYLSKAILISVIRLLDASRQFHNLDMARHRCGVAAVALLGFRSLDAFLVTYGLKRNKHTDGVIQKKFSAQYPDELGEYGSEPANNEVVFLIGMWCNHPLGMLAPGAQELAGIFTQMVKDLEEHADEIGYLGMTSWINANTRSTNSELMEVGYFKTYEGLHNFAHSKYHREAWGWWNKKAVKNYPHFSIYHETYQVPKGAWETIYVNSHISGMASTTSSFTDEMTSETRFASPVVDASKGLLKTSAGRMAKSSGKEHDGYYDPY